MSAAYAMRESTIEHALSRAQDEGLRANLGRLIRLAGHRPDDVMELQVLDAMTGRMRSAQVAHADTFATALRLATKAATFDASGVYVIANRLDPAVATRAGCGQWITALKGSSTTDRDVIARMLAFLDFDAKRPKGTSATDAQVAATADVATRVRDRFVQILGDDDALAYGHSGNGRSLFVALDVLDEAKAGPLVRALLVGVKSAFETAEVEVDTSVSDAKRLIPLFGTVKRKGIAGVADRPHRRTALVCAGNVRRLGIEELERLVLTIRDDCDDRGRAEVDKALGVKSRPTLTPSSVRPAAQRSPFDDAKEVPIADVLGWLGLLDGDRPVCPGCGISDGTSVAIIGNGLKCSHSRCSHLGYGKGFRTTVDCVVEARGVSASEAVTMLAEQFGFEGFAPKRSLTRMKVQPAEPRTTTAAGDGVFERGDHVELANAIIETMQLGGDIVCAEGTPYQYRAPSGSWETVDYAEESKVAQGFAGSLVVSKNKPLAVRHADVAGAIKLAHDRVTVAGFFDVATAGVAFKNGFVKVGPGGVSVVPHSKEHRARSSYPYEYEARAALPRFLGFLGDLFRDDADATDKTALLQEFCGACVLGRATAYQIALVLVGDGANGKSTLIDIIRESMPAGTTSAIPPQDWDQEYRRALIAAKRINVVSELPEADILASESFKAIVSGDAIVGRRIREAPFTFAPIAGHMFAANRLPGAADLTEGFWRRFLVLRFNRTFRGADARPNLAQEILVAERAAVVAWMLEGAARLFAQGRYTVPSSALAEREDWRRQANPVALFLGECTRDRRDDEAGTRATQLYASFRDWADRNGHRAMSSTKFGMRLRELGKGADKGRNANTYPVVIIAAGGAS